MRLGFGHWTVQTKRRDSRGGGNSWNEFTTKVIFAVDLLMLQEEYSVKIRQARSGNFLIASITWLRRGTQIVGWSTKVAYGRLEADMTAERLAEERRKKRTRPPSQDEGTFEEEE
eukprot:3884305-Amphidinium_carterae.4